MPQSRKRPGHHYQKPADIPASQRAKGHWLWAILLGVFGALVGYFAAPNNYIVVAAATIVGIGIGYAIGKNMEQQAKK